MPLPQMTTRRWMLAVAIVSIWLAIWIAQNDWWRSMPRRSAEYSARAAEHRRQAFAFRGGAHRFAVMELRPPDRRAVYHLKMADKWSRAARRPWLPVAADPLPPK